MTDDDVWDNSLKLEEHIYSRTCAFVRDCSVVCVCVWCVCVCAALGWVWSGGRRRWRFGEDDDKRHECCISLCCILLCCILLCCIFNEALQRWVCGSLLDQQRPPATDECVCVCALLWGGCGAVAALAKTTTRSSTKSRVIWIAQKEALRLARKWNHFSL